MLEFREIELRSLDEYVRIGFQEDEDLYKYQPLNESLDRSIDRIMARIKESDKLLILKYFAVFYEGQPIGYTVIETKEALLYSFGINIHYRVSGILKLWFEAVDKMFDGIFGCILWSCNTRAIQFLVRNSMRILDINKETVYLVKT